MNKLAQRGLLNALGTAGYIALLVVIIFFSPKLFGEVKATFLIPIGMLLVFIFSAGVTGSLVLGKPLMLYLDGEKKDALKLLCYTLAWLGVFAVLFLLLALLFGDSLPTM